MPFIETICPKCGCQVYAEYDYDDEPPTSSPCKRCLHLEHEPRRLHRETKIIWAPKEEQDEE
mgnify:CR=1 FL=1